MNFNQEPRGNETTQQMEHYLRENQNRWYSGIHDLVPEKHPIHYVDLNEKIIEPPIDEEPDNQITIDSFFQDRVTLNRMHVSSLVSQITRRNNLQKDNLYKIEKDMMKCQAQLFEIEHVPRWYNANITRTRNMLEKEILALEKEKRAEYVSCWRDLVLVKRDLIGALKEFKSTEQRQELVLGLDSQKIAYETPQNDNPS